MKMKRISKARGFIRLRYGIYFSIFFFICIALFALHNTNDLTRGPEIQVSVISDPQTPSLVIFKGMVERISHLTLNERAISPDQSGVFNEELFLSQGHTIMTIRASDRFNRTITRTIPIYIPNHASKKNKTEENTAGSI